MATFVRQISRLKDQVTKSDFEIMLHRACSNEQGIVPEDNLLEIAKHSFVKENYSMILTYVSKKLDEPKQKWRKITKALKLVLVILEHGNIKFAKDLNSNKIMLTSLNQFIFMEDTIDRGRGIRNLSVKALQIIEEKKKSFKTPSALKAINFQIKVDVTKKGGLANSKKKKSTSGGSEKKNSPSKTAIIKKKKQTPAGKSKTKKTSQETDDVFGGNFSDNFLKIDFDGEEDDVQEVQRQKKAPKNSKMSSKAKREDDELKKKEDEELQMALRLSEIQFEQDSSIKSEVQKQSKILTEMRNKKNFQSQGLGDTSDPFFQFGSSKQNPTNIDYDGFQGFGLEEAVSVPQNDPFFSGLNNTNNNQRMGFQSQNKSVIKQKPKFDFGDFNSSGFGGFGGSTGFGGDEEEEKVENARIPTNSPPSLINAQFDFGTANTTTTQQLQQQPQQNQEDFLGLGDLSSGIPSNNRVPQGSANNQAFGFGAPGPANTQIINQTRQNDNPMAEDFLSMSVQPPTLGNQLQANNNLGNTGGNEVPDLLGMNTPQTNTNTPNTGGIDLMADFYASGDENTNANQPPVGEIDLLGQGRSQSKQSFQ